ncbi:MAG: [Clostridia bacterium]|nr:[FeFe] hydrogenase H-cluster radical SAM maturase HydE [Clostridia bacterium]
MNDEIRGLIDRLCSEGSLSLAEYARLIEARTPEAAQLLAGRADAVRRRIYGNRVYIRGLIEVSNICKNDCLYCGIRRGNKSCERYRLSREDILSACEEGDALGFRTFVLQGGEDGYFTDDVLCDIVSAIKQRHPDCALTLSLGERSRESYARLREAGADRYLLRHETANPEHYKKLHPAEMSFDRRMRCLQDLKNLGYQVGCGFMVGSPHQTAQDLAMDLKFIEGFRPHMVGIGPFIPHAATAFAKEPAGSVELTCYLLSVIRLIHPAAL